MQKPAMIHWDRKKLTQFKKVYEENIESERFSFEGYVFLPGYAKYLIEHLENQFKKEKENGTHV